MSDAKDFVVENGVLKQYIGQEGNVTVPETVTSIGDSAFKGCKSLTSITIPTSVTSIGEWAFAYCSSLTSIIIPDSVTSIGKLAFLGCRSLKTAGPIGSGSDYEFGWITTIPANAFGSCRGLSNIMIPDTVTRIGAWAFCDCSSLTSVLIPDNVTSIEDVSFKGCTSLKTELETAVYDKFTQYKYN